MISWLNMLCVTSYDPTHLVGTTKYSQVPDDLLPMPEEFHWRACNTSRNRSGPRKAPLIQDLVLQCHSFHDMSSLTTTRKSLLCLRLDLLAALVNKHSASRPAAAAADHSAGGIFKCFLGKFFLPWYASACNIFWRFLAKRSNPQCLNYFLITY